MKQSFVNSVNRFFLVAAAMFMNLVAFAQEKSIDVKVDVDKGGESNWYANPWIWVVGAGVFILLLVAILRSGGKTSD